MELKDLTGMNGVADKTGASGLNGRFGLTDTMTNPF